MINSKQRSKLKYYLHSSNIVKFTIGKKDISNTLIETLDNAIEANELIKISLLKTCEYDVKEVANRLAESLNADIVEVIGRTCSLYRYNSNLKEKSKFKL